MAKPGGLLLAHILDRAGVVQHRLYELQCAGLALRPKCRLELEGMIEMVLDRRLVPAGDKDELFNPRGGGFLDGILDQRLVDDRQHFLRHRLRGGKKAGAEPADGKNGFPNHLGVLEVPSER